jgi:hypothetical protein
VLVTSWLIVVNHGWIVLDGGDVPQRLVEAAVTEFLRAAKKLDRIINAERGEQKFHGPVVLVAQRKDVDPHGGNSSIADKTKPADLAAGS